MKITDKMTNALAKELTATLKAVKTAGEKELPLLYHDLLTDYTISTYRDIVLASLGLLLSIGIAIATYYIASACAESGNSETRTMGYGLTLAVGGIASFCMMAGAVASLIAEVTNLIIAKHAPRAIVLDMIGRYINN